MDLRITRYAHPTRDSFIFTIEVSKGWFIKKKDPVRSLIRWFEKVAKVERAWRMRTEGYEEILGGSLHTKEAPQGYEWKSFRYRQGGGG